MDVTSRSSSSSQSNRPTALPTRYRPEATRWLRYLARLAETNEREFYEDSAPASCNRSSTATS